MNAIALNSSVFNLARIIGPMLAALVMAQFGVAACFLINSISFAAVIVSLTVIHPIATTVKKTGGEKVFRSIKNGLVYMKSQKEIHEIILLVAIVATLGMNFNILVPVLVKTVLGQAETAYGLLMSFMGVGSFAGAIFIASVSRKGPKHFFLWVVPYIVALMLVLLGLNTNFLMAGILLAINGLFFIMFSTSCNTVLQLKSNGEYRGRVISIYTLVFSGFTPFGNLIAGVVTDQFGVGAGFIVTGLLIAILMALLALVRSLGHEKNTISQKEWLA